LQGSTGPGGALSQKAEGGRGVIARAQKRAWQTPTTTTTVNLNKDGRAEAAGTFNI